MADPIATLGAGPLTGVLPRPAAATEAPAAPSTKADFGDLLRDAVAEAANAERVAEETADRFARGDPEIGIHEAMIAAEQASITLRFAVTLKNKAIEAYRELMNTQV